MRTLTALLCLLMVAPLALTAVGPAGAWSPDAAREADAKPALPLGDGPGVQDSQNCSLGAGTTSLNDGVAQAASLDNVDGANCAFSFVPNTAFSIARFDLPPTTPADFDLYVKKGSPPTTASYDCRPYLGGSSEEKCDISITDGTTLYAMVNRFSGSGSFNITASSLNPPPTCGLGSGTNALTDGVAVSTTLTSDSGANCKFSLVPDPTHTIARFVLTPPSSGLDPDLYVKVGSPPTSSSYDCRPFLGGNATEQCDINIADATTIYVMVNRFSGSGTFTLKGTSLDPPPTCSLGSGTTALASGTSVSASLTADTGAQCRFKFVPDTSFDAARITATPNGNASYSVYLKKGALPTTSSYDCLASGATGVAKNCTADVLDATPIYALVYRVSGSGSFDIVAQPFNKCSLGPGVHALASGARVDASLTGDSGATCYFQLAGDAHADIADFDLTLDTSDFDLYVKAGSMPTTSSYDCRPYKGGTTEEQCSILLDENDPGQDFFAMVRRFSGSGGFHVTGSMVVLPQLDNGVVVQGTATQGKMSFFKVIVPPGTDALAVVLAGADRGCPGVSFPSPGPTITCSSPVPGLPPFPFPLPLPPVPALPSPCDLGAPCPLPAVPLPTNDADLYVRKASHGGLPTTASYDCRGASLGSNDVCLFDDAVSGYPPFPPIPGVGPGLLPLQPHPAPAPGKWFVGVYGAHGAADFAITAVTAAQPGLPDVPALPGLPLPP